MEAVRTTSADKLKEDLQTAILEAYAPRTQTTSGGDTIRVCLYGRAQRAHEKISEAEQKLDEITRRAKEGEYQALRKQMLQPWLDAVQNVNATMDAYKAVCADEGGEVERVQVPRCDCGYCVGHRPIDALYHAETCLRLELSGLFLIGDGVPFITEERRNAINAAIQKVHDIALFFGQEPNWINLYHTVFSIVSPPDENGLD